MKRKSSRCNTYNLIYILKPGVGGNGLTAGYLAGTYGSMMRAVELKDADQYDEGRIWILHSPSFFKDGNFTGRANDRMMIRADLSGKYPGIPITNGWSYLMANRGKFKGFFPTVYEAPFGINNIPSVGYYYRDMRVESNLAFEEFVKTLPPETPIITMGDDHCINQDVYKDRIWRHTHNNTDFWESCTHYFYHRPKDFIDPLPHTLLEAIQTGHRIISTTGKGKRKFKDGIDDLLTCIDSYDTEFRPENSGCPCEALSPDLWRKIIPTLAADGFQKPKMSRMHFVEWIDTFR